MKRTRSGNLEREGEETESMGSNLPRALLAGVVGVVVGLLIGRSTGPAPVSFPEPDQGRSAEEMEQRVAEALAEPRAFVRTVTLTRLYEGLTASNAAGAARAVSQRAGRADPVDLQTFLGAWALIDPVAAMQEVRSWPVRSRRNSGIATVMREWAAGGDRIAAANYYQTITDKETFETAAAPLVRGWATAGDVDGALDLARRFWTQSKRLDVADGLVRGVLNTQGPTALFAIVRGLDAPDDDALHQRLVRVSLNLGGREDPIAAAKLYEDVTRNGTPEWLAGALDRLAGDWRNDDPRAALEWLLTRPESVERREALTETMATWAIRDDDAAWKWLTARGLEADSSEPLDATNATLLAAILKRQARIAPEAAAAWLARLGDAHPARLPLARRIAYFWSMRDRAGATRWIDSLGLESLDRAAVEQSASWGRDAAARALEEGRPPEDEHED
ncbi:MAG: hypothetical protein R3F35_06480 [Myxococcota bacterium]